MLTIFVKSSILDVWQGSEYTSGDKTFQNTGLVEIQSSFWASACYAAICNNSPDT